MLARALEIVEKARAAAEELGVPMAFAVVDSGGHLVVVERMDGAGFATAEIAWGKAWTAAAWGVSSGTLADRIGADPSFAAAVSVATAGRFTPRQGALRSRRAAPWAPAEAPASRTRMSFVRRSASSGSRGRAC